MTWIKFHSEICDGAKRGLPRAVRFVYLELSLKARPGSGLLALPLGMSDGEALQDLLGGNAREVKEAHRLLTEGPEPMIAFDGEKGARRLIILSWQRWNAGVKEAPGASTHRSMRHRNGDATAAQRALQGDATVGQRSGNGRSSEEKRREEKINPPLVPPSVGSPAEPAPKPKSGKGPKPATRQPSDDVDAWLAALDVPAVDSAPWGPQVAAWLDHHAAKGSRFADWAAAWRTWARNAVKFGHVDADPAEAKRSRQAPPAERSPTPSEPPPNRRLAAFIAARGPVPAPTEIPADPVGALLAMVVNGPLLAREGGKDASDGSGLGKGPSGSPEAHQRAAS